MEDMKMEIVELEEKIEDTQALLEEATSPEEAEELASELRLLEEELTTLKTDYEEQREYEGMDDWEYNGMSQLDFI